MGGFIGLDYASLPVFMEAMKIPRACLRPLLLRLEVISAVQSAVLAAQAEKEKK